MRCVARGLIVALLTVCLCLYVALTSTNVQHPDYDQAGTFLSIFWLTVARQVA